MLVDDKFTNFLERANMFNEFFRQQCKAISNDSTFPSTYKHRTDERLSCVNFTSDKILKIIQALDPNKAHGHNGVSIRMLERSSLSMLKAHSLIFRNRLNSGTFPDK